ncbi:uncharacterized protein N7446_005260 [Penicillium canescens]|uniref:Uncharacterized protein n=1 Tax=Penicillium canescens TaxID=5083 RepID=A0AAD6I9G7_PENCN|nr:uncharacterized protein N7446_005260 [Penicillium canescens]KAJ6038457.1 hypothetical protein N7460_008228 [Penicillium canescens]KAJ6068223.1 hypothetical protein N7446_005260 [Penicillium canescens]
MDSNAATVEGTGHNVRENDCLLNSLPEMKSVYYEHFKPFQDKLSSVLQHSRSYFTALAERESFAAFLSVPLISDVLVKTIEGMFETPKPRVLQPQNDEASANINWLDVVKEKNYQAEYKGNGNYHFHMLDRGVIVQLSAFQHNMILSGLPRKLVQPWSYEKDRRKVSQPEHYPNSFHSLTSPAVIKVNNTVLEEILRRHRDLRHRPEPNQRSAGSPFPLESAEEPAHLTPTQVEASSLDENAIETQGTSLQASGSIQGAGTRNFAKNRAWPPEVLKRLPIWFEDQVRKNLSQEEIAQNFHQTFKQKRTFHAIEARVYFLTGKSPFRKRSKRTSRKEPVSLTPRSSPPLSQPFEVDLTQQLISRSNIEVHALRLAPNLLPYLNSDDCEDGSLYALYDVQPVDPESESSGPHAVPEEDAANQTSSCRYSSQGHEVPSGTSQNEWRVQGSPQAGEPPKTHPVFSDVVSESQPRNDNSINVLATTSGTVDSYFPRDSPLGSPRTSGTVDSYFPQVSPLGSPRTSGTVDSYFPRVSPLGSPRTSEPIQSPIRHHSDGDTTLEELGQTLIHGTESSAMHVEQIDTAHNSQPSGRVSPQFSPCGTSLAGGSANEGSNHESHPESGLGALTVPRALTLFQVPEPSSTDKATEHHSQNCGRDGSTTDTSGNLGEEELTIRYLHEKSRAQAESSHRSWIAKDLERLSGWLMKRKSLRKERLEVEFVRDFGHYRTSSAIRAACRKKRKADSRQKDVTHQLAPVAPAVLDTMPVSRSPNAIIDTPSLDPSHTITVLSNDSTTSKHPLLERPRSPQLHHQPQVQDNTERLSQSSPLLLNEDEEAVAQIPLAVVASEPASGQMLLSSSPENVQDTPALGNRCHRVDITPNPLARWSPTSKTLYLMGKEADEYQK